MESDESCDGGPVSGVGGWCAPLDYLALPEITVARKSSRFAEPVPPPTVVTPLSRPERFRARRKNLARKFRAARFAARKAWRSPGGWWEED